MNIETFINKRVEQYYRGEDLNCATTTLKILSEHFNLQLEPQVIDAALGMHGAGEHGAQCGLVEGTLMFLGIFGRAKNLPKTSIIQSCKDFARQYEAHFTSLQCSSLRPEGFTPDNPPHLCEPLTCASIKLSLDFVEQL